MKFNILHTDNDTKARVGLLETDHGKIETPIFMPVGTLGSVKGVHQRELTEDIKAQIILGNTYHLYLRPGLDVFKKCGGLHKFMNWQLPILTDSGGYQVFSLSDNRKLTREGAKFKSHIDGSSHLFTPERVVDIQRTIGADIMMAFDECVPYPSDHNYANKSLDLTHHWLDRGLKQFAETDPLYGHNQMFFPIVQGSVYKDLRIKSAEYIASKNCYGNAIGGLAVGEPAEEMYEMIEIVNRVLPLNKPRYLMGVGTPVNLLESIALGIDMFDCVMPTRNGRNGMLFTSEGVINIRNEKWKDDFSSIDPNGTSFVDNFYTKAYLRHLVINKEMLGGQIASIHNLAFYLDLVKQAREKIAHGEFSEWKNQMTKKIDPSVMIQLDKFRLRIIDYYIIKKFLGTFFFALLLIITIAVIFDISEKVDDFITKHATLKQIFIDYYLNFIPYFAVLFSSLFTFISVIFFTSKMAYNTEIIAILNSGMSFRRLLYPFLLSAAFLSTFSFLLSNYVIPKANQRRFIFEEVYVRSNPYDFTKRNIHKQVEPGVFIYLESFNNMSGVGNKFSMERFNGNILESKLMADNIRWDSVANKWQMNNYYVRKIVGNKEFLTKGVKKDTIIKIDPKEFKRRDNFVETMSIHELNDYIKTLKLQGADNASLYIIEKEKRLAYPFSTFILTIIGMTLSTRKVRGGIGVHIGIGLALSFAYILFMQFSSQFAISGTLSPMLAAWIPNIIFAGISFYLFRIAPK